MDRIRDVLRQLGITRCYRGFEMTVYSIYLAVEDEFRLQAITKEIYWETAQRFGCKWTRVERSLRTAAQRAWQVNPALLCRMAGYPLSGVPTASEFIEIVASHILRTERQSAAAGKEA